MSSMLYGYNHEVAAVMQLSAYTRPLVFWSIICKMIREQGGFLLIRAYTVERSPSFNSVTPVIPAEGLLHITPVIVPSGVVGASGLVRASAQNRLAKQHLYSMTLNALTRSELASLWIWTSSPCEQPLPVLLVDLHFFHLHGFATIDKLS